MRRLPRRRRAAGRAGKDRCRIAAGSPPRKDPGYFSPARTRPWWSGAVIPSMRGEGGGDPFSDFLGSRSVPLSQFFWTLANAGEAHDPQTQVRSRTRRHSRSRVLMPRLSDHRLRLLRPPASGHATAAPPTSEINSRRFIQCAITAALDPSLVREDGSLPAPSGLRAQPFSQAAPLQRGGRAHWGASLKAAPHIAAPFLPRALAPRLRPT